MPKFLEVTDVTAAKSFIGLPELNVRDFGAVGNGTADDSTAISDTITALPATGGTVFFPPGTYIVPNNTGLASTKSNVRFKGDQAVIKSSNTAGTYVSYQLSVSSCSNIVVEGLTFDGGLDEGITADCNGLQITDVTNLVVRDCKFINSTGSGITAAGIKYAWISNNLFANIDYSGVNVELPPDDGVNEYVWIHNNHLEDCQASELSGWAAIRVRALGDHRYINILHNTIHNPGWIGISADKIFYSRIVGNTIIKDDRPNTYPAPGSAKGECISFGGHGCVISDNYCRNDSKSLAAAIVAYSGPDDDGSPPTVKNTQIINNRCTNGSDGIKLVWSQGGVYDNLLVQGNTCFDNTFGIRSIFNTSVTAGEQYNTVIANNMLADNIVTLSLEDDAGLTGDAITWGNQVEEASPVPESADVQVFTANGTWTKPSGAVSVHVRCVGPGGGGGAGARGPSGTALAGGRGGGSGGISEMTFLASDLPGTVSVTTAVGGIGAAGQTSDGTAGAAGTTPGQQSSFGSYLRATRGAGGGGGGLGAAGGFGSAGAGIISGQAGGASSATGAAGSAPTSDAGPGAGGGGGGITAAAAANNGGAGGFPVSSSALVGGTAGSGAAGGNGASSDVKAAGSGGGGGAANAAGAGYDGGDGGNYGAGGGGGGASLNGNTSGAGGDGGDGIVIVTTYF